MGETTKGTAIARVNTGSEPAVRAVVSSVNAINLPLVVQGAVGRRVRADPAAQASPCDLPRWGLSDDAKLGGSTQSR